MGPRKNVLSMAARRLLAVLVALLIVSSLAAALAPQRQAEETTSTTTSTTSNADPASAGGGAVITERIAADPPKPVRIVAQLGDQLALTVAVAAPSEVAITDLGLSRFATADDPARFDLLLRREGRFAVTVADAPSPVGLIVVNEP